MHASAPIQSPKHTAILDAEVRRLVHTLGIYGLLHRGALAELSGARHWSTGQLSEAIARAIERGLIRDLGLGFYAIAPYTPPAAPR